MWTTGDVSGSETLTDLDHLYPGFFNEIRVAIDTLASKSETLSNKTLTAPVINGTITGDAISTGTTVNTGTANDEIVTPKALSDSDYAKTSDITFTADSTSTVTNKRIEPRIITAASYTTDTGTSLSVATADVFQVTAQAGALKLNNPGGTPVAGQKLIIRIKDDGTARALTYDTEFRASTDLALPSTTVLGKTLYMGFIRNHTDTKWDLLAVLNNF